LTVQKLKVLQLQGASTP